MNICVSGWYFHAPLLEAIARSGYLAFVVKHRDRDTFGIPSVMTPDAKGLEFGCYQQYLMEHWNGGDVLFMQDDGEIHGNALSDIEALHMKADIDHAWIFRDEYEEFVNSGMSGRAFWCRASLLEKLKASGGFDVDWTNEKDTQGRRGNYGVGMLKTRLADDPRCNWTAIVPGLQMGRRGWISTKSYQYKRLSAGMVTPEVTV